MPSQFDNTYHHVFRKPNFDDENSKKLYQLQKEADEALEVRPPPVPTQEQERAYMDFLQEDFKSDPWVTYRFRKYTANPKRIPWKNQRQLKRQHQFTFMIHWIAGSFLAWPLAAYVGRRFKVTRGGVPAVFTGKLVHDFPRPEPGRVSRLVFRWYSVLTSVSLGFLFAHCTTDATLRCSNEWYNRPDLKPFAAMVDSPPDVTRDTMMKAQYVPLQKEGTAK